MESPQSGWMSVRLLAGAGQFLAVVGHAPYDSLRDLTEALSALGAGAGAGGGVVRWNAEPEEYDFVFEAEGDAARLDVLRHAGHRRDAERARRVFTHAGPRRDLCLAFARELRSLRSRAEADAFEQNWRRPFPEQEFQRLLATLGE